MPYGQDPDKTVDAQDLCFLYLLSDIFSFDVSDVLVFSYIVFQLIDRGFVGQPKYPYKILLKKELPEDVDDMHKEVRED